MAVRKAGAMSQPGYFPGSSSSRCCLGRRGAPRDDNSPKRPPGSGQQIVKGRGTDPAHCGEGLPLPFAHTLTSQQIDTARRKFRAIRHGQKWTSKYPERNECPLLGVKRT